MIGGRRQPALTDGTSSRTAKVFAWLLGFSLPLSGGTGISGFVPDYPDQVSPARIVTILCLSWAFLSRRASVSANEYRAVIGASVAILGYATLSAVWAADSELALTSALLLAIAMASGLAVFLVVGREREALISLILGVSASLGLQVCIALVELRTGQHLSREFGSSAVSQWSLVRIEDLTGPVAWGTLGNPNDLGGFFLLAIAVVPALGTHGVKLGRLSRLVLGITLVFAAVIGLTELQDARAFRLGLLALGVIHLLDRVIPREPVLRAASVFISIAGVILLLRGVGSLRQMQAVSWSQSDDLRLELAITVLGLALRSGGVGMGIGAESSLIKAGQIPTNFHNFTLQIAVELGFVVAGMLLLYVARPLVRWAMGHGLGDGVGGRAVARDRAGLAVALLAGGVAPSGVIETSHYWAFMALLGVHVVDSRKPSGLTKPSARPNTESTAPSASHRDAEVAGQHRQGPQVRA